MLRTELFVTKEDGTNLYRTFSDQGFFILQNETGILYEEAVEEENRGFTYTETDQLIPQEPLILIDENGCPVCEIPEETSESEAV